MLLSKLIGNRFKEMPANTTMISHAYLLRGGYIRQVSNGLYTLLPPAKRIIKKIENITRDEMDKIGGQEVLFPVVVPRSLWEETKRYDVVGPELLKFKDRTGGDFVLSMTHEEAAVHLARSEVSSYSKYPFMIYQIQTKFRDEPRSRGGLIRVREFTMKDAYSFHLTKDDLKEFYNICLKSYQNIFSKCGIKNFVTVGSDSGMMGGDIAHEFMLLSENGEDSIVVCEKCGYLANMEVAVSKNIRDKQKSSCISKIETKGIDTIDKLCEFLNLPASRMIKTLVFSTKQEKNTVIVFIRADLEVNESKLKKIVGDDISPFTKYANSSLSFGYIGPYNLQMKDDFILIYDDSIKDSDDLVAGANQENYHYKGISTNRDIGPVDYVDVKKVKQGDYCSKCGDVLKIKKGIEIGNIFELGTKYTKSMNMTYIDKDGSSHNPFMGCYGIGIGRLLASIAEESHDEHGPIWPYSVAPWQVHIISLSNKKRDILKESFSLYKELSQYYETILDDRDVSAGVKFSDADLLGVPIKIILSPKNLENDSIEIKTRDNKISLNCSYNNIKANVDQIKDKLLKDLNAKNKV